MGDVKTFDAAEVSVIVGTRRANGLSEGSFVKVTRDAESFTKKTGADGETTRSKTNNKAGKVEITVDQSSDFNDFLSSLEASGLIVPIAVIDGSGTTAVFARQGWVLKPADLDKGRDSGENTWTLDTGTIDIFIGGN